MSERVQGRCPACGGDGSLFIGAGGYLTCSRSDCPNPCAVSDLLSDPRLHQHVVVFHDEGFSIQHPISERGGDLTECGLHRHIRGLAGPPVKSGRYVAHGGGSQWVWEPIA